MRRARLEVVGLEQIKEDCRQVGGLSLLETIAQDLRFAVRVLIWSDPVKPCESLTDFFESCRLPQGAGVFVLVQHNAKCSRRSRPSR